MGKKCPYCNQLIIEEENGPFTDSAVCGACQLEQLAFVQTGEDELAGIEDSKRPEES